MADDPYAPYDPNSRPLAGLMSSPIAQIGIPLASILASAIAPRHMGRAAALTQTGWNNLNDWDQGQQRLGMIMHKDRVAQQQRQDEMSAINGMIDGGDTSSVDKARAPEGGNGPEADMIGREGQLESGDGGAASAHASVAFRPDQKFLLHRLAAADPEHTMSLALKMRAENEKEAKLVPDDQVTQFEAHMPTIPHGGSASFKTRGGVDYTIKRPELTPEQQYREDNPNLTGAQVISGIEDLKNPPKWHMGQQSEGAPYWENDRGQLSFTPPGNDRPLSAQPGAPVPAQNGQVPPAPKQRTQAPTAQAPVTPPMSPVNPPAQMPGGGPSLASPRPQFRIGAEGTIEKQEPRRAWAEWNAKNPRASEDRKNAALHLFSKGQAVSGLEWMGKIIAEGDPRQLIDLSKELGRGSADIKDYVIATAAEMNPNLDPRGLRTKMNMLDEAQDPSKPLGRAIYNGHKFFIHSSHAVDVIKQTAQDSGMPILNMTLNEARSALKGNPKLLAVISSVYPVEFEFHSFINNQHAITENEENAISEQIDPKRMTVGELLTTLQGQADIVQGQWAELNGQFKQGTGIDIPEGLSSAPAARERFAQPGGIAAEPAKTQPKKRAPKKPGEKYTAADFD